MALTAKKRKPAPAAAASETAVFPVVGIGASAGGLAAIEEFLSALPTDRDLGMAFVLVQHLDPDHKSLLLDLVSQYTRMKIAWVEDDTVVQPDNFYVMPAEQGHRPHGRAPASHGPGSAARPATADRRLLPLAGAGPAATWPSASSSPGTGSDGVLGLRAVKGEGGMAMAQEPESAAYDAMPRNAIATGVVDYVLPPAECRRSSSRTRIAPSPWSAARPRALDGRRAR